MHICTHVCAYKYTYSIYIDVSAYIYIYIYVETPMWMPAGGAESLTSRTWSRKRPLSNPGIGMPLPALCLFFLKISAFGFESCRLEWVLSECSFLFSFNVGGHGACHGEVPVCTCA